jgi:hypothetical protein
MNLRLYKFFGIICFLPIWVFRGNLNYIEIIFVISLFFILPILIHFYLINITQKNVKFSNNFFLSCYISLLSFYSIDSNLGLMGLLPKLENFKKQFGIDIGASNTDVLFIFFILIFLIFLFVFYLRVNAAKILTIFILTLLITNILDFRKNISSFPKTNIIKDNEINVESNNAKKKLVIIFDEMSGINSLESDHYSALEFKKNIKNLFEKYNFTYYPNARSVSDATDISIPTMLNFNNNKENIANYESLRNINKNPLIKKSKNYFIENQIIQNKFFDNNENKNIVVYQSLFLNYCNHQKVIRCYQYNPFDRDYLYMAGFNNNFLSRILSASANSLSIIGKFSLRIGRQLNVADSYLDPIGQKASFPYLLNNIINGLENEKANLFFAHYLVPHTPYGWDKNCKFSGSVGSDGKIFQFNYKNIESKVIQHNIERNCVVYYLDNFLKKLSKKKFWSNLEIILLSDHGSRLLYENGNDKSIIFAFRNKDNVPGLIDNVVESNFLFEKLNNKF